jgi:hypothetical protein
MYETLSGTPVGWGVQYDYLLYLLLSTIHFVRNVSTTNMPVITEVVVDEDVYLVIAIAIMKETPKSLTTLTLRS